MNHMKEEELIAYREGVTEQRAVVAEHLAACERCRAELERIEAVLAALDTLPVPDPGADYGRQVWKEIAPRLAEKPDLLRRSLSAVSPSGEARAITSRTRSRCGNACWSSLWANTWATPSEC